MKFFKRKNIIKKEREISELSIDEITYDICIEAIKSHPRNIIYVPTEYRTKELCELAVELRPENIEYVPLDIITKDMCLSAVRRAGYMIACLPDFMIDRNVCLSAVKDHGTNLMYIHNQTEEIFIEAVRNTGGALLSNSIFFSSKAPHINPNPIL